MGGGSVTTLGSGIAAPPDSAGLSSSTGPSAGTGAGTGAGSGTQTSSGAVAVGVATVAASASSALSLAGSGAPSATAGDAQARAPPVSGIITPSAGGIISDGHATLTFAPGAVADNTVVTMTPTAVTAPGLQLFSGDSYTFTAVDAASGKEIHTFSVLPQLTLNDTPGLGSSSAIYYVPATGSPQSLSTIVDPAHHTLTVVLPHFSTYVAAASSLNGAVPLVEVTVTGQVTDANGAPLPGIDVLAVQGNGNSSSGDAVTADAVLNSPAGQGEQVLATTDASGDFSLGLNRNQWTLFFGTYDPDTNAITNTASYLSAQQSVDTTNDALSSTDPLQAPVALQALVTVSGVTEDISGAPISNVQVTANGIDTNGNYFYRSATSDGNGQFSLIGPPGSWRLTGADLANYYPASGSPTPAEAAYNTGASHSVSLTAAGSVSQNLTYAPMPRQVGGYTTDDTQSGTPLPVTVPISYSWYANDNQSSGYTYLYGYGNTSTDSSGSYSFYVPDDVYQVSVSIPSVYDSLWQTLPPSYQPPNSTSQSAQPASGTDPILLPSFTIHKLATPVTGVVVDDQATPQPVSGATVQGAWSDSGGSHTVTTATASDGTYTLLGDPGTWTLSVINAGSAAYVPTTGSSSVNVPALSCSAGTGAPCTTLTVHKYPTSVQGVVKDDQGHGMAGLAVSVTFTSEGSGATLGSNQALTTSSGSYTLYGDPGVSWDISISSNTPLGYATAPADQVLSVPGQGYPCTLLADRSDCVDFTWHKFATPVSGHLVDQTGAPLSSALLSSVSITGQLTSSVDGQSYTVNATPDGTGNYTLLGDPGTWTVSVAGADPGYVNAPVAQSQLNVLGGSTYACSPSPTRSDCLDFTWHKFLTPFAGRVTNGSIPLSGVQLQASWTSGDGQIYYASPVTDGNGNYSMLVDPTPVQVQIQTPIDGYTIPLARTVDLSTSTKPCSDASGRSDCLDLAYIPDAVLTGVVATDRNPVPGVGVRVCDQRDTPQCVSTTANGAGDHQLFVPLDLSGTAPQVWITVTSGQSGYNRPSLANVPIAPGEVVSENLTYTPFSVTYSGTVIDSFGNLVSGVGIDVTNGAGDDAYTTSGSDGTWSLLGPSVVYNPSGGDITLSANPANVELYGSASQDLTAGGSATGVQVTVPDSLISGTLLDATTGQGIPSSGASVSYEICPYRYCAWGSYSGSATVDAGGDYSFLVSPGAYFVYVTVPPIAGYISPSSNYLDLYESSLGAGQSSTGNNFTYIKQLPPAVISGQVVDDLGNPVDGVQVALDPGNPYSTTQSTTTGVDPISGNHGWYSFTVDDPTSTPHTVEPFASLTYTKLPASAGQAGGAYQAFSAVNGTNLTLPNLVVGRNGTISGTILDDAGSPVDGATVSVVIPPAQWDNCIGDYSYYCSYGWTNAGGAGTIRTTTDANGAYTLSVPTGPNLQVQPGLLWGTGPTQAYYTTPADSPSFALTPGSSVEVDFAPGGTTGMPGTFTPGINAVLSSPYLRAATITGTLTVDQGTLPGGVPISIGYAYDGNYGASSHSQDHTYTYAFTTTAAGATSYVIPVPSGAGSYGDIVNQQLVPGYGFASPNSYSFSGDQPGTTYAGDNFSWTSMGTISGTVFVYDASGNRVFPVDAAGNPLPITVQNSSYEASGGQKTFTTTADPTTGAYSLPALAGTSYVDVTSSLPGYGMGGPVGASSGTRTITVGSGDAQTGADFEYLPWVPLTGQLQASDGSFLPPSPTPSITVQSKDEWGNYYTESVDSTGGFSLTVPVGQTTFSNFPAYPGYETPTNETVIVPAGGLAGVSLAWSPLGTISGHLSGPNGENVGTPRCTYDCAADGTCNYAYWCSRTQVSVAPAVVDPNAVISTWVYLDPTQTPSEVMLQFHDSAGGWEHRAYWGSDALPWGAEPGPARFFEGALPAAGGWVMLSVRAVDVGLGAAGVDGMAYSLFDGQAWWDGTTMTAAGGSVTLLGDATPAPPASLASDYDGWVWAAPPAPAPDGSGLVSFSPAHAGEHQHWFWNEGIYTATVDASTPPAAAGGNYSIEVAPGTYTISPPSVIPYSTPGSQTIAVGGNSTAVANFVYFTGGTVSGVVTAAGSNTPLTGVRICDEFSDCGTTDATVATAPLTGWLTNHSRGFPARLRRARQPSADDHRRRRDGHDQLRRLGGSARRGEGRRQCRLAAGRGDDQLQLSRSQLRRLAAHLYRHL